MGFFNMQCGVMYIAFMLVAAAVIIAMQCLAKSLFSRRYSRSCCFLG